MKKIIGIVLLCIAVGVGSFMAGYAVAELSWKSDADKVAERVAELEEQNATLKTHVDTMGDMLQSRGDKITELSSEVAALKLELLKHGIDVE